ncbi:hypothetical protein OTU49_010387, partial [Cherax quadricarinatus]
GSEWSAEGRRCSTTTTTTPGTTTLPARGFKNQCPGVTLEPRQSGWAGRLLQREGKNLARRKWDWTWLRAAEGLCSVVHCVAAQVGARGRCGSVTGARNLLFSWWLAR